MYVDIFLTFRNKRGLTFWHSIALFSFMAIALSLSTTIMYSGFNSGEQTKEVLIEALDEIHHNLEIVGKISATTDLINDKIITTATPISVATGGSVDVSKDKFKINYKLVKVDGQTITYDNIHVGIIPDKSYNSIYEAMTKAKKLNLIINNPYVDEEKPVRTSAFIYWVVNLNFDNRIDDGELAVLAIVYANNDKPSTGNYILVEGIVPEGNILKMERTISNISNTVVDIGGRIHHPKKSGD